MKEQIKKQLRELDQKQQDFVQRIGEARDLLAELMFTSDAFFTLQKRELLHHMTANCKHNPENQYTRDGIIFCNDCGSSLGFVEDDGALTEEQLQLIRDNSSATDTPDECFTESLSNFDLERMKEAVESPTVLTLTGEHSKEEIRELLLKATDELNIKDILLTKINYCPYGDNGWCYAPTTSATNSTSGACFNPQKCQANQGK